jgi:signal transduction histidine kinase
VNDKRRRLAFGGVLVAALAASVGALIVVTTSPVDQNGNIVVVELAVTWTFVASGLVAWSRRPENRTGELMVLIGLTWLGGELSVASNGWLFAAGFPIYAVFFGTAVTLVGVYPEGVARTRLQRGVVAAGWGVAALIVLQLPFGERHDAAKCRGCDPNPVRIVHSQTLSDVTGALPVLAGMAVAVLAIGTLIAAYRRSTPSRRRTLAPVVLAATITVACFVLGETAGIVDHGLVHAGGALADVGLIALPIGFTTGLLRERLFRSTALGDLVGRLGTASSPAELQAILADTLRDPDLRLAFWLPDRHHFVDVGGDLIEVGPGATRVEHEQRPVGMILHDPVLGEDPALIESVAAVAGLALERARLETELRVRLEELAASRARIVQATYDARRRLERDLHDGAQQRLVALALSLRMARVTVAGNEAAEQALDAAQQDLQTALAELRELARGIHPAVLTERGLEPALRALADRAPVPVDVETRLPERLPPRIEAAAYFVVSEALANVAKHAPAASANVIVARRNGEVVVRIDDDGPGGADPANGSGLSGLRDRVEALDGRLEVLTTPGAGTTVMAGFPS